VNLVEQEILAPACLPVGAFAALTSYPSSAPLRGAAASGACGRR
jgi:hypothetical protein